LDAATGAEADVRFEAPPEGQASPIGFSHDGRLLVGGAGDFADKDRRLVIWDARTGKVLKSWPHGSVQVAFAPDRPVLAMLENTSVKNEAGYVPQSVLAL